MNNHFHNTSPQLEQPQEVRDVGIQLFNAISIAKEQYIGRNKEIQKLTGLLVTEDQQPAPPRVVAISGLGGMGKTQLMLRFAQLHQNVFSSIIWLDASSESNLQRSLAVLAQRVAEFSQQPSRIEDQDEKDWVSQARLWLSRTAQPGWLLLMDNCDDPSAIPGHSSASGYDIRSYFSQQRQGSILITSRVSLDIFDSKMQMLKIADEAESLQILCQRSKRMLSTSTAEQQARKLAQRLDGLPLALSTAGLYLRYAADVTFGQYLELYQREWSRLGVHSEPLPEYSGSSQDRVFFATWNISVRPPATKE